MERRTVLQLHNQLKSFENVKGNILFSHMIVTNLGDIKSIIDNLSSVTKEYAEGRDKLIKSLAIKGEDGKFVLKNNAYTFEDQEALDKALVKYDEEHKEMLDKYKLILDEEVDVKLYQVDISAFQGLYVMDRNNTKVPIDLSGADLEKFTLVIKK